MCSSDLIDILKIDKAFIDDITKDKKHNLTGAIISLGHQLGLKIIAEGVDMPEKYRYLYQTKCDLLQGYLISRPLPEEEALCFLEDNNCFEEKII